MRNLTDGSLNSLKAPQEPPLSINVMFQEYKVFFQELFVFVRVEMEFDTDYIFYSIKTSVIPAQTGIHFVYNNGYPFSRK